MYRQRKTSIIPCVVDSSCTNGLVPNLSCLCALSNVLIKVVVLATWHAGLSLKAAARPTNVVDGRYIFGVQTREKGTFYSH